MLTGVILVSYTVNSVIFCSMVHGIDHDAATQISSMGTPFSAAQEVATPLVEWAHIPGGTSNYFLI